MGTTCRRRTGPDSAALRGSSVCTRACRLPFSAFELLAAIDLVSLVDGRAVLIAWSAVDGFFLTILRVDVVVARSSAVGVDVWAARELVVAPTAVQLVVARSAAKRVAAPRAK